MLLRISLFPWFVTQIYRNVCNKVRLSSLCGVFSTAVENAVVSETDSKFVVLVIECVSY